MNEGEIAAGRKRLRLVLKECRNEKGLRQADVAAALGKPQSFVSKYERGDRRLELSEVRAVCAAIGVSLVEVIQRAEGDAP